MSCQFEVSYYLTQTFSLRKYKSDFRFSWLTPCQNRYQLRSSTKNTIGNLFILKDVRCLSTDLLWRWRGLSGSLRGPGRVPRSGWDWDVNYILSHLSPAISCRNTHRPQVYQHSHLHTVPGVGGGTDPLLLLGDGLVWAWMSLMSRIHCEGVSHWHWAAVWVISNIKHKNQPGPARSPWRRTFISSPDTPPSPTHWPGIGAWTSRDLHTDQALEPGPHVTSSAPAGKALAVSNYMNTPERRINQRRHWEARQELEQTFRII